jgi:glyoxylase-like metal-dependent hydrolase (beta-lactamase superfamily II)
MRIGIPAVESTSGTLAGRSARRRRIILLAVCFLLPAACCFLLSFPLHAARGLYEVREVKPNVFVWIANDIRDFQGDPLFNRAGTSGFIITSEGVVVVDTTNSPFHARELLYEIRQRTELPVRYIINTSADGDRMLGNEVFVDQQATIVATNRARAEMRQYQQELAVRLESDFQLPVRMRGFHPTLPTQTFEGEMVLRLGGQEIKLESWLGPGPLTSDAGVYVPGAKVLFLGALYENGFVPRVGKKDVQRWIEILRQVETWDVQVYVPRRGPPGSKQDIADFRRFLEWLVREVSNRLQAGKSVDEVKNELLSLANFPPGSRDLAPAAVEAVYEQLAGTPQAGPVPGTSAEH